MREKKKQLIIYELRYLIVHLLDHGKIKRIPEKHLLLYAKAFDYVNHNKQWKILKQMRISGRLTCLLRNLYAGQEAPELDMGQKTGSNLGKEYIKPVYCHPTYLTYMQSTS